MTERFQRHRQAWTSDELQKLHMFAGKGMSLQAISKALTRTEESIKGSRQDGWNQDREIALRSASGGLVFPNENVAMAGMQFTKRLREPIISGEVTCSVRIWQSPRVKVGGRYRLGGGAVEITSIHQISPQRHHARARPPVGISQASSTC